MRTLYISHDGLCDPLGQSQILPYIFGLAHKGHRFHIISCEKPDRFNKLEPEIRQQLAQLEIEWTPIRYHKRPAVLATVWDIFRIYWVARFLVRRSRFDLVHCRSYIGTLIGLRLKKRFKLQLLFDMRGFWADERVDGGLWNLKHPLFGFIYRFFKKREKEFLLRADQIVTLTHRSKDEMMSWSYASQVRAPIEVIPCCVDEDHFSKDRTPTDAGEELRKSLGLSKDSLVVVYLGSIGTWYLLEPMMRLFSILQNRRESSFLFVTPDSSESILQAADYARVSRTRILVKQATRREVPHYLSIANLGIFFIRPCFSKMASSPTKMAELLSMGLPVISNRGVGDSDWLYSRYTIGTLVDGFDDVDLGRAVHSIPQLLKLSPQEIRNSAKSYFSLAKGIDSYQSIYRCLEGAQ